METRKQPGKKTEPKERTGEGNKTRDNVRRRLESSLREWDAQIEKLRARARIAQADLKLKYYREIKSLQRRRETFQDRFEELKKSKDDAWVTLKSGTEKAMSELRQALDKAMSKFK